MSTASTTPIEIPIRRGVRFDFASTPGVHTASNPYLSHFWNALSVMAPSTERILILVARSVRDRITDERLRTDLDALVAQEALHTREHRRLNARLAELGYDIEGVNAEVDRRLDAYVEAVGPKRAVALMIAGEHLIYELSHAMLEDPRVTEGMDPEVKRLLCWHAAEEMEHQSVAHDVFVHLHGDGPAERLDRARAFVDASRILVGVGMDVMGRLMAREAPEAAHRWELVRFMALSPGYGRQVLHRSLRYFRPGFAPWGDRSDLELIDGALSGV